MLETSKLPGPSPKTQVTAGLYSECARNYLKMYQRRNHLFPDLSSLHQQQIRLSDLTNPLPILASVIADWLTKEEPLRRVSRKMRKCNAQRQYNMNKAMIENKRQLGDWPVFATSKKTISFYHLNIFFAADKPKYIFQILLLSKKYSLVGISLNTCWLKNIYRFIHIES